TATRRQEEREHQEAEPSDDGWTLDVLPHGRGPLRWRADPRGRDVAPGAGGPPNRSDGAISGGHGPRPVGGAPRESLCRADVSPVVRVVGCAGKERGHVRTDGGDLRLGAH